MNSQQQVNKGKDNKLTASNLLKAGKTFDILQHGINNNDSGFLSTWRDKFIDSKDKSESKYEDYIQNDSSTLFLNRS